MQELEQLIKIYHVAFIVFLVLTILFFVISVALFIHFDIRGIFDMRSGRGAKRAVQKMEEINAQTGKLRQDVVVNTPVSLPAEERIWGPPTEKGNGGSEEAVQVVEQGARETELLYNYNETTVLTSSQQENIPQPEPDKLPGAFKIEKEIMWIHTEEML